MPPGILEMQTLGDRPSTFWLGVEQQSGRVLPSIRAQSHGSLRGPSWKHLCHYEALSRVSGDQTDVRHAAQR